METEKVVFFLDYATTNKVAWQKGCHIDYHDLLYYLGEGRLLMDAHCYVPINPRNEHRSDRDIEDLWRGGYLVTTKRGSIAGGTYRCKFEVEITMDLLQATGQCKPDIIVLATSNANFVPLIQEVRKRGVRVEIAAFEDVVSTELLLKCSGFINLATYYAHYLAAQKSEQGEEEVQDLYKDLIQSQEGDLAEASDDETERISEQEHEETSASLTDDLLSDERHDPNDTDALNV